MTPPKKWPQNAEDARMECLSLTRNSAMIVEKLMDMIHGDEAIRLLHKVSVNSLKIESKLNEVKGRDIIQTFNDYLNVEISEEK